MLVIIAKKIINKYTNLSVNVKATLWFVVCNFVVKGIAFVTVPLFARFLSTNEYGIVTIYNSYQQILCILATFEFSLGVYNRGYLKYKNDIHDFTASVLSISSIITISLFVILLPFYSVYACLTEMNFTVFVMTFCMFALVPAYNCWLCQKRYQLEYKSAVIVTILYSVFTTVVPLIGVVMYSPTGYVKIFLTLFSQIIFYIPFYYKLNRFQNSKVKKYLKMWKYIIPYQIPLVFHALSFFVLGQIDRVMIGDMVGKSEAAIYSVAYSIGQVIMLFQVALNQVFQPHRFKRFDEKDYKNIFSSTNSLAIIISIIIVLFLCFATDGMKLLFTDDYSKASYLLPPIAVSVYFIFLYNVLSDLEAYFNKTKYVMIASLVAAFINIFLNYYFIRLFGYEACAYTTLFSYMILAYIHFFFTKKIQRDNGLEETIYDYKKLFMIGCILSFVAVGMRMIIDCVYIRYMILMIGGVVCILNRKNILDFFYLKRRY